MCRGDDERIRGRVFHARAPEPSSRFAIGCATRTGASAIMPNRTRCDRRVNVNDVASVSAPTTTCAVLIATFFWLQDHERAQRHLSEDEAAQQERGPPELRPSRMVMKDVSGSRCHCQRHEQRAEAVRVVNRDLRRPLGRNDPSEHQRKVRYRQPGVRVAHRRAHQNLHVHECRRARGGEPQHTIVNGIDRRFPPSTRREQRDCDRQAEKDLREPGVCRRHRCRQEVEHRDSAEDSLRTHGCERR